MEHGDTCPDPGHQSPTDGPLGPREDLRETDRSRDSKPIVRRASSASASLFNVLTEVWCCPLSIRLIAEWLVLIRSASSRWLSPSSARRMITIRAISSNGAIRATSARYSAPRAERRAAPAETGSPTGLGCRGLPIDGCYHFW